DCLLAGASGFVLCERQFFTSPERAGEEGRMSGKHSGPGRAAFTLIELLVVMAIIVVLAVLGAVMLPSLFADYGQVRSVDQLTQWLLSARQRAKRDGLPTGLRLLLPTDDNGNVVVNPDG